MITQEDIRKRLIEVIKQSGLTQTAISKNLAISQQTLSHYINGNKMPALDTFANLCVVLDVDANEILGIK
ncbi:MAG: helix-turn-helix transcriptional regulator [Clostridia bacterium]|nr:helix-turn-helix transcriptional regulator [Clostridia bacterium]